MGHGPVCPVFLQACCQGWCWSDVHDGNRDVPFFWTSSAWRYPVSPVVVPLVKRQRWWSIDKFSDFLTRCLAKLLSLVQPKVWTPTIGHWHYLANNSDWRFRNTFRFCVIASYLDKPKAHRGRVMGKSWAIVFFYLTLFLLSVEITFLRWWQSFHHVLL